MRANGVNGCFGMARKTARYKRVVVKINSCFMFLREKVWEKSVFFFLKSSCNRNGCFRKCLKSTLSFPVAVNGAVCEG